MSKLLASNPPRPRLHYLSTEDLERALDDPALAALAASGWAPVATLPVEIPTQSGPQRRLILILWPPATNEPTPNQEKWPWLFWACLVVPILICAAFAAGVML